MIPQAKPAISPIHRMRRRSRLVAAETAPEMDPADATPPSNPANSWTQSVWFPLAIAASTAAVAVIATFAVRYTMYRTLTKEGKEGAAVVAGSKARKKKKHRKDAEYQARHDEAVRSFLMLG